MLCCFLDCVDCCSHVVLLLYCCSCMLLLVRVDCCLLSCSHCMQHVVATVAVVATVVRADWCLLCYSSVVLLASLC